MARNATAKGRRHADAAAVGGGGRGRRVARGLRRRRTRLAQRVGRWWAVRGGSTGRSTLEAAVKATDGLSIASLHEVRQFAAMAPRDGALPAAAALRDFVASLRRTEQARRSREWARGRVGVPRERE